MIRLSNTNISRFERRFIAAFGVKPNTEARPRVEAILRHHAIAYVSIGPSLSKRLSQASSETRGNYHRLQRLARRSGCFTLGELMDITQEVASEQMNERAKAAASTP